jgi:hypothetical protein
MSEAFKSSQYKNHLPPSPFGRRNKMKTVQEFDIYQKNWVGAAIAWHGYEANEIMDMLGMNTESNRRTFNRWGSDVESGKTIRVETGRRSFLSGPMKDGLLDKAESGDYPVTASEFNESVLTCVRKTLDNEDANCSHSYLLKLKKSLGLRETNADITTNARDEAERDSRSAITFAVLCSSIASVAHPSLILNADATQFNVGASKHSKPKVIASKRSPRNQYKVLPSQAENKSHIAYSIKYYLLIAADGIRADPVYILADSYMKSSDIDVYEVRIRCYELSVNLFYIFSFE